MKDGKPFIVTSSSLSSSSDSHETFPSSDELRQELAAYRYSQSAPELGNLIITITGEVLASNLDEFKRDAMSLINDVSTDLQTDDDFVAAGHAVKWCKEVENKIDAAKENALSRIFRISSLFADLDELKGEARSKRLSLEKLIKYRKDEIRKQVLEHGFAEFEDMLLQAKEFIKSTFKVDVDFAVYPKLEEAIKGRKNIDSIREAVSLEVGKARMQVSEISLTIAANLSILQHREYEDYRHIFHDISSLCLLPVSEFRKVVTSRVDEAKKTEEKIREQARIAEEERQKRIREQEIEADSSRVTPTANIILDQTRGSALPYVGTKTSDPVRTYQYTVYHGRHIITAYVEGLDICEGFIFEDNGDLKTRLDKATNTYREQCEYVMAMAKTKRIR